MKRFAAPWGKLLVVVSTLATLVCLVLAFLPRSAVPPPFAFMISVKTIPLGLLAGCALFVIRGYAITPDTLLIQRLFWSTRFSLHDLQSAEVQRDAMRGAWRLCGNGGLYSFTGLYRNKLLGTFRAFVTDGDRTVVLRFAQRTIVLSPEDPEAFVREVLLGKSGRVQ